MCSREDRVTDFSSWDKLRHGPLVYEEYVQLWVMVQKR